MSGEPRVHDEAGQATAEQGQVVLDGPDGVAVTFTPDAARETGRQLIAAADEAVAGASGKAGAAEAAGESEAHPS